MNRDFYHGATKVSSVAFAIIGVLLLVVTLVKGGSPTSIGLVLGILFLAVGLGRLWIASKTQ